MASHHVAYKYAIEMAKIVLEKEVSNKLKLVPLSNNVIQRWISDLSLNILDQVIADIRASPLKIALQLDKTTYVLNCS